MTICRQDFGSESAGLKFAVSYDAATGQLAARGEAGSLELTALWSSDGNSTSDGFTVIKSGNSLNMNGSSAVWNADGTSSADTVLGFDLASDRVSIAAIAQPGQGFGWDDLADELRIDLDGGGADMVIDLSGLAASEAQIGSILIGVWGTWAGSGATPSLSRAPARRGRRPGALASPRPPV